MIRLINTDAGRLLCLLLLCFQTQLFAQLKVGDTYPEWTEGYMDIHHINTGRGECVFVILPDGTTMMIDAGEVGPSPEVSDARPNDTKSAGEWTTRYITRMMRPLPEKRIDYILLTHFHPDHMGDIHVARKKTNKGNFALTGVTELGTAIPFRKIVDRGWPDYNWPASLAHDSNVQNYIRFVKWHIANGATAEQFQVGSNRQFSLLRQADKYPEFEIRNIAANGRVWTGVRDEIRNYFPLENIPDEDQCSAAIRISYGKFDYFSGGDIINANAMGTWPDIETPVGLSTGPVEVCKANHHGAHDAMGEGFLSAVRPRVIIVQTWYAGQLENRGLQRMLAPSVYPGERDIFTTNLMEATRRVIGRRSDQLKSQRGHIVTRVHPGGDRYDIYVLDDEAESFMIKAIHGPYESR
jgi:beta-lactamase superfamily II metal-dependent hydrolase